MAKHTDKDVQSIRNGRGRRNHDRERKALKLHYQKNNLPCSWCGQPFDWTLTDHNHVGYFTADHPEAIAHGGKLVGQEITGMHRGCNSSKGNKVIPKGNLPTTDVF